MLAQVQTSLHSTSTGRNLKIRKIFQGQRHAGWSKFGVPSVETFLCSPNNVERKVSGGWCTCTRDARKTPHSWLNIEPARSYEGLCARSWSERVHLDWSCVWEPGFDARKGCGWARVHARDGMIDRVCCALEFFLSGTTCDALLGILADHAEDDGTKALGDLCTGDAEGIICWRGGNRRVPRPRLGISKGFAMLDATGESRHGQCAVQMTMACDRGTFGSFTGTSQCASAI